MSPTEITDAYNLLAQQVRDQAALDAAKIGNSQRSLGTLASRVASPSGQTSGLANYTYNRMLRPAVDTAAQNLVTQGQGQALSKFLNDALLAAKSNYEDAQNRNTAATAAANNLANQALHNYATDTTLGNEQEDIANQAYPKAPAGTILGIADIGNGRYEVRVSDGRGGTTAKVVGASSSDEALNKYRELNPGAMTSSQWQRIRDLQTQAEAAGLSWDDPLVRFADYINWDALGR